MKLNRSWVQVSNGADGSPGFILHDPKLAIRGLGIRLSLSHSRETAIAVVLVVVRAKKGTVSASERNNGEPE